MKEFKDLTKEECQLFLDEIFDGSEDAEFIELLSETVQH